MVQDGEMAVLLRDVSKSFGGVQALTGLCLAVPKGHITVLLGPNGAGKTTAVRTITGALPADGGTIAIFGMDPRVDGERIRMRSGVVSAKPALYDRMSGWDNLSYAAALYDVGGDRKNRIRDAAARFGIEDSLEQFVGGYSTGMKTRLALARALLHEPDLLLLDEPTSGLDPESSHAVLALIRELTADGTTIIMCTHLLVEAEGLADQIVMLDSGINLLEGSQSDLIDRYWPYTLVHFDAEDPTGLDALDAMVGVRNYQRNGMATAELESLDLVADCVDMLTGRGVRLTRVEPHRPSLEELYFRVRREHRERTGAPEPAMTGARA
ncbi:MAG: ABC transporter ATP-binding protein [Acidimicrobiales bacterium]